MPQKTIPELTYISKDLLNSTDSIETSHNSSSFRLALTDLCKAIFSKFHLDTTQGKQNETIESEIEAVLNKNTFEDIVLIDEKGGKWRLYINRLTSQLEWEKIIE